MKTIREMLLTDYDAARSIFEAWARDEPLEYYAGCGSWVPRSNGLAPLAPLSVYRIAPRHHTVDWSQVGERIVAFHTSADGTFWAASTSVEFYETSDLWPSFRPGTLPWQESRIERPKEVK